MFVKNESVKNVMRFQKKKKKKRGYLNNNKNNILKISIFEKL